MDTLSRREEEALSKATKARALNECSELVKCMDFHHISASVSYTVPYNL